jgi:hypothetical protein
MNILSMGAEFYVDRERDRWTDGQDETNIVFLNFANAPTKGFRGNLVLECDCKQAITFTKK